ncbi:MAG: amidase family protein [Gammaproteobacteria bacterium]
MDAVLAPATPAAAARSVRPASPGATARRKPSPAHMRHSCPANLAGLPAIAVPCGFGAAGLPVAIQILGQARSLRRRHSAHRPRLRGRHRLDEPCAQAVTPAMRRGPGR